MHFLSLEVEGCLAGVASGLDSFGEAMMDNPRPATSQSESNALLGLWTAKKW